MTERAISQQEDTERREPFLKEVLEGMELSPGEVRAVQSADILPISLADKKTLVGAYMFLGNGVFRPKAILGLSYDQSVNARDRIRTNQRYEALWNKFETLMQPNFAEVSEMKKQKIAHRKIGEALGLTEQKVDVISIELILKGIIKPSPKGERSFQASQASLSQILLLREDLSVSQIAAATGLPEQYVKGVLKRHTRLGGLKLLDKKDVIERSPEYQIYIKIREGVMRLRSVEGKRYTEKEIAEILSSELNTGVSVQQVKRQIRMLLKEGKIKRRINQTK